MTQQVNGIDPGGKNLLFVYGSLKKGFSAEHHLTNAKLVDAESNAFGILRDGMYPGFIPDPEHLCEVRGELYQIDDSAMWDRLDRYEGVPHLYERRIIYAWGPKYKGPVNVYMWADLLERMPKQETECVSLGVWEGAYKPPVTYKHLRSYFNGVRKVRAAALGVHVDDGEVSFVPSASAAVSAGVQAEIPRLPAPSTTSAADKVGAVCELEGDKEIPDREYTLNTDVKLSVL